MLQIKRVDDTFQHNWFQNKISKVLGMTFDVSNGNAILLEHWSIMMASLCVCITGQSTLLEVVISTQ